MDHVAELRGRLFWVAVAFVISAGAAYPFYHQIVQTIVAPLGGQELYYTTPAGGLSLIIKVCMYVGMIGMMPVFVYQLYRFISPVMHKNSARSIILYTISSVLLAGVGIAFAYFISLPASLYFLTNIEVNQVSALLTLDAYLSFIAAYIIAGALLFQLPLIMMIVNSITPLPPKRLMGYQRIVIVGAFIISAIISPTPDAVNQSLLAAPIVIMYQIGIGIVWYKNRRSAIKAKKASLKQARNNKNPDKSALAEDIPKKSITHRQPSALIAHSAVSTTSPQKARPITLNARKPVVQNDLIRSSAKINTSMHKLSNTPLRSEKLRTMTSRKGVVMDVAAGNKNKIPSIATTKPLPVLSNTLIPKPKTVPTQATTSKPVSLRPVDGFNIVPRYDPSVSRRSAVTSLSRNLSSSRGPVQLDMNRRLVSN